MLQIGTVWDRTTGFLSDRMGAITTIAVLLVFVPASISGSIAPLGSAATTGERILLDLVMLVLALIGVWGQLAVIALALQPAIGAATAVRLAVVRMPLVIGIGVLLGIAFLLLTIPFGIAFALAGLDMSAFAHTGQAAFAPGVHMPAALGTFVALYAIVFVVAGLWIVARLLLINPVVVGERHGFGSIARSFRLTRGLALRIVGVMILYAIVLTVAELAVRTVFGSILALVAGGTGTVTVATVITQILVAAVGAVFSVLAAAFIAELYLAARGNGDAAVPLA